MSISRKDIMDKKFLGKISNNLYRIMSHHSEYMHVFLKGKELFAIHGDMSEAIERLSLIEPIIEVTNKKVEVRIEIGDIFDYKEKVDAIVDPTNTKLKSSSGLGYAIQHKAGEELRKELNEIGPQSLGTSFVTDAYNVGCRYLIHTVSPDYIDGFHMEEDILRECYENCLQCALDEGIRSIAFPSISTGGKGFPLEKAANIAMDVIFDFCENHKGDMEKIFFVLSNDQIHHAYMYEYKTRVELEPFTKEQGQQKRPFVE